ncbi:MAG: hypothetical protein ABSH41_06780 [Syntrophobacteraceae bacterium]
MSQEAYTCIEQLDLASRQLEERSASYGRFALILVDNVVELIIHRVCAHETMYDDIWVKLGKPRLTPTQRSDVAGRRFDRKVKFCRSAEKLTSDQTDAILICHKYRNELYHSGLKYDDIVWDLSWYYYGVATDLLAEVYPERSWYSGAHVTAAVEKHAGKGGQNVLSGMADIAKSLESSRPERHRALPEALSASAQFRLQETEDSLEFLVKNDPQSRSEEIAIHELQFYDYIRSHEPLIKQIWDKVKTPKQQRAAMQFVREIWTPKYKTSPLPAFARSAKEISQHKTDLDSLRAFERFQYDFAYFSRIVEDAAIALDMYIQEQIDIRRGK